MIIEAFYVLFFQCFTITTVYSLINGNVTFQASLPQLQIPHGLYGHLSTVYNHSELHLFGGYINTNPSYSLYTILSDNSNTLNGTINNESFTSLPMWDYMPPQPIGGDAFFSPSSISCTTSTKCYDAINDTLYAFIPNDARDNLFVYKYNMITKTLFTGTAYSTTNYVARIAHPYSLMASALYVYNHEYENVMYYVNGCIVSDRSRYIYSFGTTASWGSKYHGFRYDVWLDDFSLREFDLLNTAYDVGCEIDVSKQNIYLFGGRYYNGFELDMIQKWNLKNESSTAIADTLQYTRSGCTVLRNANNYFIIIGGTTYESKRHMEVFDANTDQMMLLLSMDVDLSNMEQFTAFLFTDMLYIHGGMNNVSATNSGFLYTNVTEHIQRHVSLNHTENFSSEIVENATKSEDDENTIFGWETLQIQLPQALAGHISSVYNDTLHITGGYVDGSDPSQFSYTFEALPRLLNDKDNITITDGPNFQITSQIMPNWESYDALMVAFGFVGPTYNAPPSAISCRHDCYTQIGDTLYIQLANDDQSNLFYVKYNLSSSNYHVPGSPSDDNYRASLGSGPDGYVDFWDWPEVYLDQCVVDTNEGIILAIGGYGGWESSEALAYDTTSVDGSWSYIRAFGLAPDSVGFTDMKTSAMACERYGDNWLYMFGGRYRDGYENNLITKLYTPSNTKYIVDAEMKYKRSYFKVSPITIRGNVYFIIYDGTTANAKKYMEIFDPLNDKMVTYDNSVDLNYNIINDYDLGVFDENRISYSSFMYDNHLFISGGMVQNNGTYTAVNDFKRLNLETLFDVNYSYRQEPDYSCMHIYYTPEGGSSFIYDEIDTFIYDE
eukprot:842145_1